LIDVLAGVYDEPLPTVRHYDVSVCQLARQRVTVALSGDGGDENLAGYLRYAWHLRDEPIRKLFSLKTRQNFFRLMERFLYKIGLFCVAKALSRDSLLTVSKLSLSISIFRDEIVSNYSAIISKVLFRDTTPEALCRGTMLRSHRSSAKNLFNILILKPILLVIFLTKVDRASMANSLEVRVPFLDVSFVEWMSGLPPNLKMKDGEGKYLLKKAMAPYLPHDLMYRKKWDLPYLLRVGSEDLCGRDFRQELLDGTLAESGLFNRDICSTLLKQHAQFGMISALL